MGIVFNLQWYYLYSRIEVEKSDVMKKKLLLCLLVIIVIICIVVGCFFILNKKDNTSSSDDKIPDGYIAVFHGGVGEQTYETYIYKIDNGHANSGFKYINVTSTTKEYGSSEWKREITGKGKVQWTDDVFPVAEKNGAYSYVTVPDSDKTYTIEEFQRMFIMN